MAASNGSKSRTTLTRRSFLGVGASSAALLGTGFLTNGCTGVLQRGSEGQARNIVFLVSDGMSTGTLSMADHLLRRRDGRATHWIQLYADDRARRGQLDMASLDSLATDSSAASSAWGCGHTVANGAVNQSPDGQRYTPILPIAREGGKSTGLVTTTRITHATPAGFAAISESRSDEDGIAAQYLDRRIDVLLGGGRRHFDGGRRGDGRDLAADFRAAGYHVINTKPELEQVPADGPLLGTFYDGHLPYALDHANTPELVRDVPHIAEMTRIALDRLSRNRNGFVLQVEGGRVDHAAHRNDLGGLIYDQLAFDEAIGVVIDFVEDNPDTLVILATDHGNANPGLNGVGSRYRDTNDHFDRVQHFRHTTNWIADGLDRGSSVDTIRQRMEEATRLQISAEEAEFIRQALRNQYEPPYRVMRSTAVVLGQIIANHTSVNWTGTTHTSDYVELGVFGPGSDQIRSFMRGAELFQVMTTAAGLNVAVQV